MPSEAFAYLDVFDGDLDAARAALIEVEAHGSGVLYEARDNNGVMLALAGTPAGAARIAELRIDAVTASAH